MKDIICSFFVSSYLHLKFLEVEGKYQVPISHTRKNVAANTVKILFAMQAIQSLQRKQLIVLKKTSYASMKTVKPLLLLTDRKLCKYNMQLNLKWTKEQEILHEHIA